MGCVACLSCVSSGEASYWQEPVSQFLGCWLLCSTHCCCELPSLFPIPQSLQGRPWRLSGKESACQCRRPGFDPWVWRIPWRRKWQLRTWETRCLQTIQWCQFPQCSGWGRIKVGLMASVSQGWGNPALTSLSLSSVGEITGHLG